MGCTRAGSAGTRHPPPASVFPAAEHTAPFARPRMPAQAVMFVSAGTKPCVCSVTVSTAPRIAEVHSHLHRLPETGTGAGSLFLL